MKHLKLFESWIIKQRFLPSVFAKDPRYEATKLYAWQVWRKWGKRLNKKNNGWILSMNFTDCLIGIIFIVYYKPHITGWEFISYKHPLKQPVNQLFFFHCSSSPVNDGVMDVKA